MIGKMYMMTFMFGIPGCCGCCMFPLFMKVYAKVVPAINKVNKLTWSPYGQMFIPKSKMES